MDKAWFFGRNVWIETVPLLPVFVSLLGKGCSGRPDSSSLQEATNQHLVEGHTAVTRDLLTVSVFKSKFK